MKKLLAGLIAALALALPIGASAHTSYTGHSASASKWMTTPWGYVEVRDVFAGGHGSGPHYHNYRTVYWASGAGEWRQIHMHYGRQSPAHQV